MENTIKFFEIISQEEKSEILQVIAKHYGITEAEAYEEVTDPEAEQLFEYMVGPAQMTTYAKMKIHRLC